MGGGGWVWGVYGRRVVLGDAMCDFISTRIIIARTRHVEYSTGEYGTRLRAPMRLQEVVAFSSRVDMSFVWKSAYVGSGCLVRPYLGF